MGPKRVMWVRRYQGQCRALRPLGHQGYRLRSHNKDQPLCSGYTSPDDITEFPKNMGSKSLLSRALDREVWEQCKCRRDAYGGTLQQCISSGIKWTDSKIGVYAGSHSAYYTFAPLFGKVIHKYHGHALTDPDHTNRDYTQLDCLDFLPEKARMIRSTRIRAARKLAGYPMGPAVSAA